MFTPITIRVAAPLALLATFVLALPAHATDPGCKPAFDAMAKMAGTPYHQTMTENAAFNKKPTHGEIISTADAMYVQVSGAWHRSPYNPRQAAAELREAANARQATCKYLRDETVAGEAVAVYDTQEKQDDGTVVASQLWISKSRGLPLKQTIDMDVGGRMGKSHSESHTDYANVRAPVGAQ